MGQGCDGVQFGGGGGSHHGLVPSRFISSLDYLLKPLRIFTHVSENDNRAKDPEETYHNWVMANERTAAALKAKGYDYRYVFSRATKHCDQKVFQQTLADTLVWTWRGYHAD